VAWRAPQLGPGTVLVNEAPTAWADTSLNYEFSSPANFIYGDAKAAQMPHSLIHRMHHSSNLRTGTATQTTLTP